MNTLARHPSDIERARGARLAQPVLRVSTVHPVVCYPTG